MRRSPASLLALHLAWATALPILHARLEVAGVEAAFEGGHSSACHVVHRHALGSACAHVLAAGQPARAAAALPPTAPLRAVPAADPDVSPAAQALAQPLARGPPNHS